ncbi:hypothetical protein LSH36_221g00043 [Paralvinella palmiformis]|uniref:Uncharacterized protein n=1 Tax=Paralvinella palmiformis TaxID=53620 RepID=A0AAD9JP96_9ANNE|nr:hypothetical protein LSH36_221g00043 [Paralvinella palmiformis]
MLIFLTLWLSAIFIFANGQDCGSSSLLLHPGQAYINANETVGGRSLSFSMPVTIFDNSSDTLHISVWNNTKTCFSVFGTPDCSNDFTIKPLYFVTLKPTIERGAIYYRHTSDQNELIYLQYYLCPDFSIREAVVITYYCLGENLNEQSLTVQVVVVTSEDREGVNRTILLVDLALFWNPQEVMFGSIGHNPLWHRFSLLTNYSRSYDITNLIGWTTPYRLPWIPQICPTIKCTLMNNIFEVFEYKVTDGMILLLQWNPPNNDCKFKLLAKKQCNAGCKGEITSFDYDIAKDDTVYAKLKEIDPGKTYVVETELCADDNEPNYKLTYNFNAGYYIPMVTLEMSRKFYYANKENMSGFCA